MPKVIAERKSIANENMLTVQMGFLIIDALVTDRYFTLEAYDWYDWMSCGDNTALSWITVDRMTGKVLTMDDLVDAGNEKRMEELISEHLRNRCSRWLDMYADSEASLLDNADGVALVKEGLVVYYYPYDELKFVIPGRFLPNTVD